MYTFTRNESAPDGIHGPVEFNEYHDAEFWENVMARKARRESIMEKLAPYLIVLGTVVAFLAIGYMESAL